MTKNKNAMLTIALVGNPNCGKTTMFNRLTGTHQKVGNWTGVTVEKKEGVYKKNKNILIVDLPGIYSLSAQSNDEKAVIDFLEKTPPDAIINVVDGTNLERNLYLSVTLNKIGIPVVIAVNFSDQLKKDGIIADYKKLGEKIGAKVIGVSALKGENTDLAVSLAEGLAFESKKTDIEEPYFESNIKNAAKIKRLNGINGLLTENENKKEEHERIAKIIDECVKKTAIKKASLTDKIDKVVLNKYLCFPVFIVVMTAFFALSVRLGGLSGKYIEALFTLSENGAEKLLKSCNAPDFLISFLLCIIAGLKSVFAFLPHILIMFLCLSVLEQSGYMARVAFICDKPLGVAGLGGKSVIPLVLASGCTVTGLMATRTIEDENERERTVLSLLFVPCGAKAAVISFFTQEFFGGRVIVAVSLYFLSLFTAVGVAVLLKTRSKNDNGFVLEMPPYRVPSVKDILYVLYEKIKDFTVKAGTVIMSVSIVLWVLKSFGINGYTENVSESFLYYIGNGLKYLLYPIGVHSWECAVSALSGLLAREAVIETLPALSANISDIFSSPFTVYAFVVFILFLPPCAASLSALKGELKNNKKVFKIVCVEIAAAYIFAAVINLLQFIGKGVFSLISALFVGIIILLSIKSLLKNSCVGCKCKCVAGDTGCEKTRISDNTQK